MKRRVVVTGIGWVTPLGADIETAWGRLLDGQSGVGRITRFDAGNFPVQIAAEVRDWEVTEVGEDPAAWEPYGLHAGFAVGAAKKAVADSGILDAGLDPARFGVYTGSGEGNPHFEEFTEMMVVALKGPEGLDMPGFTPTPSYVREMQRFGILPATVEDPSTIDVYAADEAYWRSHWWRPGR